MHKDDIEVRLCGYEVGIGDLRPRLVHKVQTYRLLKQWGLSLEEIRYLTSSDSDDIMQSVSAAEHRPVRSRRVA